MLRFPRLSSSAQRTRALPGATFLKNALTSSDGIVELVPRPSARRPMSATGLTGRLRRQTPMPHLEESVAVTSEAHGGRQEDARRGNED
eukprot:9364819-Pyramimonas_sp.AAC.1